MSFRDRLATANRGEAGWVLVTAMVVMAIMLGVGLAVLASADTQAKQSRGERARESAFNLAEGLLQAESVVLQNNWPTGAPCATNATGCGYQWSATTPASAPGATCTQATATNPTTQCPSASDLVGTNGVFSNVDQSLGTTTWSIKVRDDLGVCLNNPPNGYSAFFDGCQLPTYYQGQCATSLTNSAVCWPAISTAKYSTNPSQAPGTDQTSCKDSSNASVACTWDANGDNQLWVRVDATVNGKTRSLVALLRLENFPVNLTSKVAVTGGAVNFGNTGNKGIVDANNATPPQGVIVSRCYPTDGANPGVGNALHTTVAAAASAGQTTLQVANVSGNISAWKASFIVAVGVGNYQSPPYELLTIKSVNTATNVITFNSALKYPHAAGEVVELAPMPSNDNKSPNNCETWNSPNPPDQNGADKHQLDPYQYYTSNPNQPNLMDTATFAEVTSSGTITKYTNTCPPNTTQGWTGNIYIVNAPAGGCSMPNGTINSLAAPKIVIVGGQTNACSGTPAITVSGNTVFYGVVYVRDLGCSYTQSVMTITAGAQIDGGVAVDGHGLVNVGNASNSGNCTVAGGSQNNVTCPTVKYDPVAWGAIAASGAAGLVQNTWRELAPGQ